MYVQTNLSKISTEGMSNFMKKLKNVGKRKLLTSKLDTGILLKFKQDNV